MTDQFRIRFSATDNPNNSVTEGGIDRFQLAGIQCDMSLAVTPASAAPSEFVDLTTWKGRTGGLCRLMVMAFDGVPLTIPLALGPFNAEGDYSLSGNLPNNPNLSGHSIGFQSFGISPSGAIEVTNMATLVIQ